MSAASKPPLSKNALRKQKKAEADKAEEELLKAEKHGEGDGDDDDDDDDDDEGPPSSKKPSDEHPYRGSKGGPRLGKVPPTIWQRATYRWVAITVVVIALLLMYTQHPYYRNQQFQPFKAVFPPAVVLWLIFGIFYVKATLEKFPGQRIMMRDSGLHLVLLAKAWQKKKFWRVAKNKRVKTTLLAIIVKAFFTPLMIGFVTGHLNNISRAWLTRKHLPTDFKIPNGTGAWSAMQLWWDHYAHHFMDFIPNGTDIASLVQPWTWSRGELSWGMGFTYDCIFAVDCGWALFGYATESRWLGNKTKSVEPTAFGWAVCIACYPPFNNVLGTYLPLDNGPAIITSEGWLLALRGGVIILFAIYASATVAFGFRFSNLTNRGIIMRGPYKYVRHPAYLCKCSAWWLEHLPTMNLPKAFFLTLLCGVYALRAWTEERHLSADPEYLVFKKKTPWVLFPGIY